MALQKNISAFDDEITREATESEQEQGIEFERVKDYGYEYIKGNGDSMNTIDSYVANQEKHSQIDFHMDVVNRLNDFRFAIFERSNTTLIRIMNRMTKKAGIDFKFDDMYGMELMQAMKQISEKKEFQSMLKENENAIQTFKIAWDASYQLLQLGFDIETSKHAIKAIINPFNLKKANLVNITISSPIKNHSVILCVGNEGIIGSLTCSGEDSIESNMMKEIIHDDVMGIFPKHEGNIREKVTALTALYGKFKDKAGAFFMAEAIKDSVEDSPLPFKT